MSTTRKILREIKSLFIIVLIALSLRATVIEAYIVPTGSMENTIMTGDFLIGNKFIFGMRTPDWIGIPYTDFGFNIPWTRFPEFRSPEQGDVIIFKYPRDVFQKYVKRLIGMPGQTIEIREKKVYLDGEEYLLPTNGKFKDSRILSPDNKRMGEVMFLREGGNRDNLGPLRIPKKGDEIPIQNSTNWDYLLPIMIMDGHRVTVDITFQDREYIFIMNDPDDLARRYSSGLLLKIRSFFTRQPSNSKKIDKLYRQYYRPNNQHGKFLNVWNFKLSDEIIKYLNIDGKLVNEMDSYTVEQDYYWMMGDNRDDSADSRYWGFVPHDWVLGKALFTYMSWDFKKKRPRLNRIGKVIS